MYPSMKLGQWLSTAWKFNHHPHTLRSPSKPGRAKYYMISSAIYGTATISHVKTKSITVKLPNLFSGMTNGREDLPLSGFLTLTPLPGPYVGELSPITAYRFTTRSPDNTPLTNHASTSANHDLVISPAFVEANYEEYDEEREMELRPARARETTLVLRTGSPRIQKHRGRVIKFKKALNMDGSRVERESDGKRHSKQRVEKYGSRGGNLHPLLVAHLGRSENGHPLQLTLTFEYGGNQPLTNLGGNLPLNGRKKNKDRFSPYKGSNHRLLANLSKSLKEILAMKKVAKAFEQPPCMVWNKQSRDMSKYYHFHKDYGHETNQSRELRYQIKDVVKSGKLAYLVKEIKKGKAKTFDTQLDSGRSYEVIYEHCFLKLKPSIRSPRLDSKISLIGFSGEHSWPLREVPFEVTVGGSPYTRMETINFVIIRKRTEEGKRNILEVTKDVLSCVDVEERIDVKDKHPEQTVFIGKQLPTRFPRTIMVARNPFNMEHKLNEYKHIELEKINDSPENVDDIQESFKEAHPTRNVLLKKRTRQLSRVGHLKEQIGSPYRTRETICMTENPREVHKLKAREDEGDMDVGWDIIVKDVERLRQFLTHTIYTLPNLKPVVQPNMSPRPVHDKEKVTFYVTPLDDAYVAPATSPTLDKRLNEFRKECFDITRVAEKAGGNPVKDIKELSGSSN
nr:hypothetical protein [Tanacetum cinerariifolium]